MSNERYSAELLVSIQDFRNSGWKDVLGQTSREGYPAMWQAFSAAARAAIGKGQQEQGKVLWLLADVCSMMLSPASRNEPFKPYAVFHDRRSVIPEDLFKSDIDFFSQIVDEVDDYWLKARIADLLWLKLVPRDVVFALKAIEAYRCVPLDHDIWIRGARECWARAISLAKTLKAGAGDQLQHMEALIIAEFDVATRVKGFYGLWLADLLKANGLGRGHRVAVAKKLEALGNEFDSEGNLPNARMYFTAAAEWHKSIPDEVKAAEMTVAIAESWVKEAVSRTASEVASYLAAASFYENAIQIYRMIPRSQRATHLVDDRIEKLRTLLSEAGDRSLGEMATIQTPGIDITQLVDRARSAVSDKSIQDALLAFTNLHLGANVDELRRSTIEKMQHHPLQFLFSATVLSRDGRVIAKRPAMSLGGVPTADDEIAIRAEMIHDYAILVGIVVQGDIMPALEVLLLEHRLSESNFIELAQQSPIVPKERAGLFGKALFAGYELDFVTALHLLAPQIEHMVRLHLKDAGAKTSNLDKDGIENENGLSTLMELPEVEQVFGKNISFELRSLFCDAFGPNLRNVLAHGLIDEAGCHSAYAIYAWWFALRLTFMAWWNTARPATSTESPTAAEMVVISPTAQDAGHDETSVESV